MIAAIFTVALSVPAKRGWNLAGQPIDAINIPKEGADSTEIDKLGIAPGNVA